MCLPAVIYFLIFAYKPMYGIIIAFKDYSMRKGSREAPWSGFANFQRLFELPLVPHHIKNTLTPQRVVPGVGVPDSDHPGADP